MPKLTTQDETARRLVEEAEILRLAREDQTRFAETLIAPPEPNERLRQAATYHANLVLPR